jgi:hypothetical protein
MKFVIVAFLLCITPAAAENYSRPDGQSSYRVAQGADAACKGMIERADQCYKNWRNMGGGRSGQAGSFYDCMTVYCQGATAACGRSPNFCP